MRLSSSWWRIVRLSSWVLINSQSPSTPIEEEDGKRPGNEHAVALRKGRLVNGLAWTKEDCQEGDMDDRTSQLVLFHVRGILCNVLSDSKVYFFSSSQAFEHF